MNDPLDVTVNISSWCKFMTSQDYAGTLVNIWFIMKECIAGNLKHISVSNERKPLSRKSV